MRAALEVCGEFLSRIGALQDVNGTHLVSRPFKLSSQRKCMCSGHVVNPCLCLSVAIAGILHKTGVELSETSSFRWRALLAAIRQELDAKPMDSVFLFDRVLQLHVMMSADSSLALFRSPLFLHVSYSHLGGR